MGFLFLDMVVEYASENLRISNKFTLLPVPFCSQKQLGVCEVVEPSRCNCASSDEEPVGHLFPLTGGQPRGEQ